MNAQFVTAWSGDYPQFAPAFADEIIERAGPATITAASVIGAGGVKTILGLDKEGPAIIAASSGVGMGGIKGGVGSAAWLATGEFLAGKAPDMLEITDEEIGRTAVLQPRNYTARL